MALASWFRLPKFPFAAPLNKARRRPVVRRQPLRPRLFLESLEARVLLDGASGVIGGGLNNLAVNGGLGAAGLLLPIPGSGAHAVGLSGLSAGGSVSLAATDSPLAQDQPNSQFRLFAVNSEGDANRLALLTTAGLLHDAYGFGSGVQPNAPWAPAAYNVGLGNHQFGYPSQIDNGFQSVPPWYRPVSQVPQNEPLSNEDAAVPNDDAGPATTEQLPKQTETDQTVPEWQRGDPAIEEALFSESPYMLLTDYLASSRKPALDHDNTDREQGRAEDVALAISPRLSALAPLQLAAVVAVLPAREAPSEEDTADAGNGAAD
jgi:hypothetical protein